MEDDGFTRVSRSKKQRMGGASKDNGKTRKKLLCNGRVDGDEEEVERTMERAMSRVDEILVWMRRELDRALRGRPLVQVLIYGNGNFDGPLEPGSDQLALAIKVAQSFPAASIYFQDPQCSSVECAWLERRGVVVRRQTAMAPPPLDQKTKDACRLIFFIHNPHGLLEELLRSDWECGDGARSVLVCNDYGGWSTEEFDEAIDGPMPVTREFVQRAKISRLPVHSPAPFAFHQTALIYLTDEASTHTALL